MSALDLMHQRAIEGRRRGNAGYVTDAMELKEILAELTERVPVRIWIEESFDRSDVRSYGAQVYFALDPNEEEAGQ